MHVCRRVLHACVCIRAVYREVRYVHTCLHAGVNESLAVWMPCTRICGHVYVPVLVCARLCAWACVEVGEAELQRGLGLGLGP